ncbi:hypothetical protein [Streptomyces sp. NPDC001675]
MVVREALRTGSTPTRSPSVRCFRIIEADDGPGAVASLQEVLNKAVQRLEANPRICTPY